jgi:hypothetical protein
MPHSEPRVAPTGSRSRRRALVSRDAVNTRPRSNGRAQSLGATR